MTKPSLIRSLSLLGTIGMLTLTSAAHAAPAAHSASASTRAAAGAAHAVSAVTQGTRPHLASRRKDDHDSDTWTMWCVALAAVGYALRRQQRALGSLQPLVH